MTYQSAYLNIELISESKPKKTYSFTIEIELKALLGRLITALFATPDLRRSVGPGQIKQVVNRDLGHSLF